MINDISDIINRSDLSEDVLEEIDSKYSNYLTEFNVSGEDKTSLYLNTQERYLMILDCTISEGEEWCNGRFKGAFAGKLWYGMDTYKYYIANINSYYYLFTDYKSITQEIYDAGPIIYF